MSIQISNIDQANLLQDLNTVDSSAVVGGHGYGRRRGSIGTGASVSIPSIVSPVVTTTGSGTATTFGIANTGAGFGAGIGFGSAFGSGFTGASSVATSSTGTAVGGGSTATGQGSAFTGGISGIIGGTFDRL